MNREDIQKLLGGYATGTLTPEEQQTLFAAALDDQALFDALAREQSLRDLLRDPAAKAQVLAALDTVPVHWYRSWWRPAAVAVAMAGVAALALVVVRQKATTPQAVAITARKAPPPAISAELRAPEPAPPAAPSADLDSVARRPAKPKPLAKPVDAGATMATQSVRREVSAQPSPPPNAPQPPLADAEKKAEALPQFQAMPAQPQFAPAPYAQQSGAVGGIPAGVGGAVGNTVSTLDARALFYGTALTVGTGNVATGNLQRDGAIENDAKKRAAPMQAPVRANSVAGGANSLAATAKSVVASAPNLGVRCSLLRKQASGEFVEASLETVLDRGEAVKLKLVPNDAGSLLVWTAGPDGGPRTLAAGPAERLKDFETPLLEYQSSGPRQLYVELTRNFPSGVAGAPSEALILQARANVIQTAADLPEKATYVVNRFAGPSAQRLIVPITLNYK